MKSRGLVGYFELRNFGVKRAVNKLRFFFLRPGSHGLRTARHAEVVMANLSKAVVRAVGQDPWKVKSTAAKVRGLKEASAPGVRARFQKACNPSMGEDAMLSASMRTSSLAKTQNSIASSSKFARNRCDERLQSQLLSQHFRVRCCDGDGRSGSSKISDEMAHADSGSVSMTLASAGRGTT